MKNIFLKIKEHWDYEADPQRPEDVKFFSKEWLVFILFLLGIIGILALFAFLCTIFNVDIDTLFGFLMFGGLCFFVGIMIGLRRADK